MSKPIKPSKAGAKRRWSHLISDDDDDEYEDQSFKQQDADAPPLSTRFMKGQSKKRDSPPAKRSRQTRQAAIPPQMAGNEIYDPPDKPEFDGTEELEQLWPWAQGPLENGLRQRALFRTSAFQKPTVRAKPNARKANTSTASQATAAVSVLIPSLLSKMPEFRLYLEISSKELPSYSSIELLLPLVKKLARQLIDLKARGQSLDEKFLRGINQKAVSSLGTHEYLISDHFDWVSSEALLEFRNKHKPKKSQKPPVWRKDSISSVDTDEDDPSSTFSDFESKGQKDDDYVEPPGAPMGSPQLSPEGEMRAAAGANSIELYLINPLRLVQIRDSLMTLSHEQYIDGIAMDQWLLKQYQQLQEPLPRYIPMTYLLCDGPPWGPDEIDGYRRIYDDLPLIEEGPCIMQDCVGVILVNRNHYCCVIFRPEAREIHILGRTGDLMGKQGNWTAIGSQDVWRRVCLLNGWQLGEETMHIKEVGLPQNGYDCGPIVCQAITHMWTERLVFDSNGYWERPALLCCHTTRLTMLRDLQISLVDWITIHAHLQNHYPALIAQYLDLRELVDNLQKSLTPTLLAAVVIPIEQNLLTSMAICAKCKPTRPFHPQRSCQSEQLSKLLKGARRFNPFNNIVSPPAQDEDGDNPSGGEKDDDEFELGRLGAPTEHTPAPLGALIERFPRRVLPVPLTPRPAFPVRLTRKDNLPVLPVPLNRKNNLRGLRLPFDRNFDEYETGPTASALLPVDDTIEGYAPGLVYIAKHILLHGWEHFHDYGWRILPSFAQMFHMTPPTQVGSHIMREVPDDLVQPSCTEPPSGYDVISMGLEDMIAHARTSQEAINIVVTGLDSESRHVHVDITKDQLILGPDDLAVSADIDSVIFVTREPRFMKPVAILTSPVIRDRAPIWKNNHAYAELLVPPSDEDRDAGGARTDWLLQCFALSRVPHVHLGIQGGLSSMVNLYLFFPRMTHKAPYSRFWTSKVPAHIQYLIWEDVILPSLRRVIGVTEEVYAGYDQDHVKFKQGGKSSATPSFPLSRPKFAQFLRELDQMIRALDQEGKTQYGSYFFVLENKGCKSYCRATYEPEIGMDMEDTVSSAFRKCQETFDGLDWSYMLDPSNGGDLLLG
ncbi:hypothetical protein PLEOSDRAFT_1084230, partial [Pleurotus ostreatus PC15]